MPKILLGSCASSEDMLQIPSHCREFVCNIGGGIAHFSSTFAILSRCDGCAAGNVTCPSEEMPLTARQRASMRYVLCQRLHRLCFQESERLVALLRHRDTSHYKCSCLGA